MRESALGEVAGKVRSGARNIDSIDHVYIIFG